MMIRMKDRENLSLLKKYLDWIIVGLIVVAAYFLLSPQITKPFYGHHDFNSNIWTLIAKNNLKDGLFCTKFAQSTAYWPVQNCQHRFYMNTPSLMSWVVTGFYALFGLGEWVGRLPFALLSTATAILLYFLVKRLYSWREGVGASFFMMATPMFRYFGKLMTHDVIALFGTILALYLFVLWLQKSKNIYLYALWATAFLLGLTAWMAYPFFLVLAVYTFIVYRKKFFSVLPTIFILIATFIAHQVHIRLAEGVWKAGELFQQFAVRTNLSSIVVVSEAKQATAVSFSLNQFVARIFEWLNKLYTLPLVLLALAFGCLLIYKLYKKQKIGFAEQIIAVFGIFGLINILVFSEYVYIHDFLTIYLAPFLAMTAVYGLQKLAQYADIGAVEQCIIAVFGIIAVFFLGNSYARTLLNSNQNEGFYYLSYIIRDQGLDKAYLIESKTYSDRYPILWNYDYGVRQLAGRYDNLASFKKDQQNIEKEFDSLIFSYNEEMDPALVKYLEKTYNRETANILISKTFQQEKRVIYFLYDLHSQNTKNELSYGF
ncbi:hypothetical protein GYA49_04915 [Candidatus Beckwithbacteria bacterium]|nr:hypothetical protein [Candidatus Beckwithbacteria bacterium]